MNLPERKKYIARLIERDGVYCHYCGVHLTENLKDTYCPDGVSIDHVFPLRHGGGWEFENLVLACRRCNQKKKDHDYSEFHLTAHTDGMILFLMGSGDEP